MTKPKITVKLKASIILTPLFSVIIYGIVKKPEMELFSIGASALLVVISSLIFLISCPRFSKKLGYELI